MIHERYIERTTKKIVINQLKNCIIKTSRIHTNTKKSTHFLKRREFLKAGSLKFKKKGKKKDRDIGVRLLLCIHTYICIKVKVNIYNVYIKKKK
jgi:hypothetical protein